MTYNPLKWDIFKEPYAIKNGMLTIPDKPGFGVELIDDIKERFPWVRPLLLKRTHFLEVWICLYGGINR